MPPAHRVYRRKQQIARFHYGVVAVRFFELADFFVEFIVSAVDVGPVEPAFHRDFLDFVSVQKRGQIFGDFVHLVAETRIFLFDGFRRVPVI